MRNGCKYLFTALFIILGMWICYGQSRIHLQKLIDKNKSDIALTKEILKETQSQKVVSLQLLNVLQRQIESRKSFISNLGHEISTLDAEIEVARTEISAITNELNSMKSQFGNLICNGYKAHKNNSKIQFLFSSSNFNQAFKRLNYLRKLLDYRRLQLELIILKQQENSTKINQLLHKKDEKLIALSSREEEQNKLITDQNREEQIIKELKNKESDLNLALRRKQQQADQLDRQIKDAIEREKNVVDEPSNPNNPKPATNSLTTDFGKSMGKLPWPVRNGYISEYFGVHKHSELKNIQTENNGVNITAASGSEIYPVFGGTVSAIMEVPGLKRSVLINHQGYYTVYANLEEVFIKRGDLITAYTSIGRIVKNEDGITELHFEVWKGAEKMNPTNWLAPR